MTSYIESAAGTAVGGRTGLTAVVVSVLFLVAPEACVRIFTDDPAVIRQGATCLRIAASAGEGDRWMHESRDIVASLEERFGA